MRRLCGLALILLALLPMRCGAVSPAEYGRALAQVQSALTAALPALRIGEVPTTASPRLIAQRVLSPVHSVERPGAAPQPVDTRLLRASLADAERVRDLKKRGQAYGALVRQIATLRRDLAAAPPMQGDPLAPTHLIRAVVAAPVYASDPLPPPSLSERFAAWLAEQWRKLHLTPPSGPAPTVNPAFAKGLLIVLCVGLFALLVSQIVQALNRSGGRSAPLALDETEAALVEARDTDSLMALAEQQARAGDHRRAFRLVYVATLVALDTGGVLRFDRSKTNWEYLRALRAAGRDDVYQAMTPLTRDFDRLWYGVAPASAVDYSRAVAQYQALQAAPKATVA